MTCTCFDEDGKWWRPFSCPVHDPLTRYAAEEVAMPEATVYQCDKTEGLKGKHLKCGKEVDGDGVYVVLEVGSTAQASETKPEPDQQVRKFCVARHAQYWLIRQRVARDGA